MKPYIFFLILINLCMHTTGFAQLGETYDIDRPEKYQEKVIGYEKTYKKKYTLPRKFIQNTISHYNFYFNANEKLKNVIASAKENFKDTFDQILSYYPYSLNYTKSQKQDLDSVIQKATGGILIHDLRTNWVDNFYFLIGQSYLLQQKYDSALMTFNYINYEYGPKSKDKERVLSGSNTNDLTANNTFSISTKENSSFVHNLFQRPPSRNETFIWMIRSYIESDDYGSAASLSQTLKSDPLFPTRLQNDLNEVIGYLFYKQQIYDSAAHYVVKSISMADGKNDKARRHFLAGQMYEMANNNTLAVEQYSKSINSTLDPVMEVYARLNSIKTNKGNDPKIIENNIAALNRMAKKDGYEEYRDIIYYFAGKMELERKNTDNAIANFYKSSKYTTSNVGQKNKTFLELANIMYSTKKYRTASNFYDSIVLTDPSIKNPNELLDKKTILKSLVKNYETIEIEDSLQKVAAMPIDERTIYIDKLLRKLRKEQGLKEDGTNNGNNSLSFNNNNSAVNLFESTNGEWYFYNTSLRSNGFNEFKRKWGNRPNVDNWQRVSSMNSANSGLRNNNVNSNAALDSSSSLAKKKVKELTEEALLANLPLNAMALKASNDSVQLAMFALAKIYHFELDDIPNAIETYENLAKRFPDFYKMDEVLFNTYLCANKLNNLPKAAAAKAMLEKKYKDSKFVKTLNTNNTNINNENKAYNEIYSLFVEGNFEKTLELKKQVQQENPTTKWSPNLLYLEAIYYAKMRNDSAAIKSLNLIINSNNTVLVAKAKKLKEVLLKRDQIEKELNALQVTRNTDEPIKIDNTVINSSIPKPINNNTTSTNTPVVTNVNTNKPVTNVITKPKDSIAKPKPVISKYPYKQTDDKEQYIAVWLNKVDNIFVSEARNAFIIYNRSAPKTLMVENYILDNDNKLLIIKSFANSTDAFTYMQNAQLKANTDIMPWLAKEKYSFLILTEENLKILMNNKDLNRYKAYLNSIYPGKFQ